MRSKCYSTVAAQLIISAAGLLMGVSNVFHKRVGQPKSHPNHNIISQQPLRRISPEFVNKVFITLITLTSSMNCNETDISILLPVYHDVRPVFRSIYVEHGVALHALLQLLDIVIRLVGVFPLQNLEILHVVVLEI